MKTTSLACERGREGERDRGREGERGRGREREKSREGDNAVGLIGGF